MRRQTWLVMACCTWAVSSFGQGTVNFVNLISGGTLDARVYYAFGTEPIPADDRFLAQLWAAAPGNELVPVGSPIPFRSTPEAGHGYFIGAGRTVPSVAPGAVAVVKLVAWPSVFGTTYAEAMAHGIRGESDPIEMTLGGDLNPPRAMVGLQGFTITALNPAWAAESLSTGALAAIPEPGVAGLLMLGAGLLVVGRRR